ncbi:hypothetical protein [Rubinisphaera italica]|uniref:Uncharacterized protein n=1 Tax=Rubinisphaera italica TaxID=2527969 RepID=A0A5C5XCI3_9PLAN|nr:hypothetical protein [Rubinisphaera italica]TWT60756.1 hypothetical protein Pan54_14830 [Rubinisphaera italica]
MLFLGIDQHARQLSVSLRVEQGDVLLVRQASTRPAIILQFIDQLTQRCAELMNRSLRWWKSAVSMTDYFACREIIAVTN